MSLHRGRRARHVGTWGYWHVQAPENHPRTDSRGYVREHVLIAERALGHHLAKHHPVHHFDGDRKNNAESNLVICESEAYHQLLHMRQRALAACGNPDWRPCMYCKSYDDPAAMLSKRTKWPEPNRYHRACGAAARKRWNDKKEKAVTT